MRAIIPVSNDATVEALLAEPGGVVSGDWVTLSSGGVDRPANPVQAQVRATRIARALPGVSLYAFTSGLANVEALSAALKPPVTGIFYDYEPNYPNEPEFSFDALATAHNLTKATQTAWAHGLRLVGYLTGQALLNPNHTWDYSAFRGCVDDLVVQTQSALRRGRWSQALDKIEADFGTAKPAVQITVAPGLPNAVDVATAQSGWAELLRRRFTSVVVWWIPSGISELRSILELRKRLG